MMKMNLLFYLTKQLRFCYFIPKHIILFACLGYVSFSLKAQITLPLDQTVIINTLTSEDIIIPEGIESLTLEVRGADGGNARLNGPCDVRVRGGQGATMIVTFPVGPEGILGKLAYGGTLRVFAGRAGQNDDSGCAPAPVGRYGAGGGSSAILYKTSDIEWEVLAIAGGGGGGARVAAGIFRTGKGGNADRSGDATGGSPGGNNGGCGSSDGNGYGGAGIGCHLGGETGRSMVSIYALSNSGLNVQLRDNSYATQTGGTTGIQPIGGDGFTGGATGAGGGGGGGGFSGGAGDNGWPGGGGGSYIATLFSPTNVNRQAGANGASTNHPTHGFVKITTKPICPVGDVVLSTQQEVNDFASIYPNCTELSGNLSIQGSDISDLSPLDNITSIDGILSIFGNDNLQAINGFTNLTSVVNLSISLNPNLREVSGFSNLNTVGETLRIYQESNLETIVFPSLTSIGGMLYFGQNDKMINLDGFSSLTSIGDMLTIFENDKLVNLNGLLNLTSVGGIVHISGNATLTNFDGICPLIANGYNQSDLDIEGNGSTFDPAMDCLICPSGDVTLTSQQEVNNFPTRYINCTELPANLTIQGVDISDLSPLSNLTSIQGNLRIEQNNVLTNLNGLNNVIYIGSNLDIRQNPALLNIDGLGNIREMGNNISIVANNKLQSITGFSNFETSEGSINIASNQRLTRVDGFTNLEWLRLGVSISNNPSLISVKGFSLVYSFDKFLSINSNSILTEIDGFDQLTNVSSIGVEIKNNTVLVRLNGFSNLTSAAGLWIENNPQLTNIDVFCPLFNDDFDLADFIQSGNGVIFNPDDCICPPEDIILTSQQEVNDFLTRYPNCTNLEGNLTVSGTDITNLAPLNILQSIGGDLTIENNPNLQHINSFSGITSLNGTLSVIGNNSLLDLNGFTNLSSVKNLLILDNDALININALSNVTSISDYLSISRNPALTNLTCFSGISTLGKGLRITDNPALENIDLSSLMTVGEDIAFGENDQITDMNGFSNLRTVGRILSIYMNPSLASLNGLSNLTSIGFYLAIENNPLLTNFDGLCPLFKAGFSESDFYPDNNGGTFDPTTDCICPSGDVILTSQQEVNNFGAIYPDCSVVQGDLTIKGGDITDLSPLENLTSIEGYLYIQENTILATLNGLSNITSIGDYLFIYKNPALLNLDGLANLNSVDGTLSISFNNSLQDLRGLSNLRSVEGVISISRNSSLQTIEGFSNLSQAKAGISIANNPSLIRIEGFSNIRSIYGEAYLSIFSNRTLVEVDAFHSLETAAGDGIGIENNNSLTTLHGFSNLRTVSEIYVQNNPQLTNFETFCPLFETGFELSRFHQSGNGAIFDPAMDCECVQDNSAPDISCVENTRREIAASASFYTVQGNEFDAVATDNCELASITNNMNNSTSLSGIEFGLGNHEIIWTAVDAEGNTANCTTNVSIEYPASEYFITTWWIRFNNEEITIPTQGSGYNYTIDWGDGTVETGQTGDATHTYATARNYTIRIAGDFPRIYFEGSSIAERLLTVEQWGNMQWESMEGAFRGCLNLNFTNPNLGAPDLSRVTSMKNMFSSCLSLNAPIGDWDVSQVTDMTRTFQFCRTFNQDLSGWDVSKVTNMLGMFSNAPVFNKNIGNWDVGNVTNMLIMFAGAKAFNQDISNWNVGEVTNMQGMFGQAELFNQDISNWDVSKVTDMASMFAGAKAFNQDIGGWDVQNVATMEAMFYQATSFDQDISNWHVEKVANMSYMFLEAGLSTANYDALLMGWSTQNLQSEVMFDAGGSQYCEGANARAILTSSPNNWSISDGGVSATCPPMALCQDISIELAANGEVSITPEQIDMGSSSPIGEVDLSLDISTFTCNELGDNTVILTVTDMNGKSSNCTATVTVEVNEPLIPTATVGEDQVVCDAMSLPLGGNDPIGGIGVWSGPDGVSFLPDANDPNAIAQGLPTGTSTLTWTISGGICQNTSSSANIQVASTEITAISALSQTACDPWTNTYSQTLEITYEGAPTTGHLSINGQLFPIETSPQTIVLTDITSDGQSVDIEAHFTDRAECTFTQSNVFTAPSDCSVPCDIISVVAGDPYNCNPNTDTYHRDLTVEYQGTNLTGNIMVSVNGGAAISYPILAQSPQVLTLEGLPSNGAYADIEIYISEENNCSWVANNLFQNPQNCGDNPTGDCDISDLTVAEQRCNYDSETYAQDLIITYTDAPAGGSILLKANGQSDWESFPITGSPQVLTLEGRIPGEGNVDIFVKFSDDNGCTFSANDLFSAPEECVLPCAITSIATGTQTTCDPTTNTYSQELIIIYENEPLNGSLIIGGQAFAITGSPQMITLTNLPSDGNEVDITAYFTDHSDCQLTETNLFTAPEACTQPPSADGIVLFVVKDANNMHSGDASVKNQLENTGYTVEVKSENIAQSSDATGKALVLISNTVSSGAVNTKFTNVAVSVVCYESLLFDELGMTGGANGSDYGQDSNEQTIDIDNPSHPMAAGFSGEPQVYSSNGDIIWGKPNNNAIKVASTQGWAQNQWSIFGYETGSNMVNGVAPARRASLFFKANQVSKLNANGWALFDAVICWATGCQTARFAPEVSQVPTVKAYPNPFSNNLTIEWDNHAQEVHVTMRNLLGQQVLSQKVWLQGRYELATGNLPEGMYILQIIGDDWKQEVKVVKE